MKTEENLRVSETSTPSNTTVTVLIANVDWHKIGEKQ